MHVSLVSEMLDRAETSGAADCVSVASDNECECACACKRECGGEYHCSANTNEKESVQREEGRERTGERLRC